MQTDHRVHIGDSRTMDNLADNSVELVVTSPPYPMIEMWDEVFGDLNPDINDHLTNGRGQGAFTLMHEELNKTWQEVARVLVDGGIACINIGDATRTVDGNFRVYQNHSRIIDAFEALGFEPLPEILWRKPVNSAAKFMGSGMLPPNAYATLEHEYILIFRNGTNSRTFEPKSKRRYHAAYFWEERNRWFSDVWTDIRGTHQTLGNTDMRNRSAAYPFAIPYRLISMYSVYGDTVLDPFWGTGTTSLAAMVAARNSIGYELDEEFTDIFAERVAEIDTLSKDVIHERMSEHQEFAKERQEVGEPLGYPAEHYDFPVMTKQEQRMLLYITKSLKARENGYSIVHEPYRGLAADDHRCSRAQTSISGDFS